MTHETTTLAQVIKQIEALHGYFGAAPVDDQPGPFISKPKVLAALAALAATAPQVVDDKWWNILRQLRVDFAVQSDPASRRVYERINEALAAAERSPAPQTLLERAVADREARPWNYYKLDHDVMKRMLNQLQDKLEAVLRSTPEAKETP